MTNKFIYYVYEHWRTDRSECFYVGKGKRLRAYKMLDRNRFHTAVRNKVLREGFAVEVLIVKSGLSEEEAFSLEKERIRFWRDAGADLANITSGGAGPCGTIAWNRKKIICLETGKVYPSVSAAALIHNLSPAAIAEVCNGGCRSIKGIHFVWEKDSHKTIREIEAFCAARRKLVEKNVAYGSISDGRDATGRLATGPQRNSKKVICIDDNRIFTSASETARHYNVSRSAVIELCLKKNRRVSVGGLKFEYVEQS